MEASIKSCTVANQQCCTVIGSIDVPITLENKKVKTINLLVVPDLNNSLILGMDFKVAMDSHVDRCGDRMYDRSLSSIVLSFCRYLSTVVRAARSFGVSLSSESCAVHPVALWSFPFFAVFGFLSVNPRLYTAR